MKKWFVLLLSGMCVFSARGEQVPFVKATAFVNGENGQYDLANDRLKIYAASGMLEYQLNQVLTLSRDDTGQVVRVTTVYGDQVEGQLINQGFQYLFFNDKQWLSFDEPGAFRIDIQGTNLDPALNSFVVDVRNGDRFVCHLQDGSIQLMVDGVEQQVDLASLAKVSLLVETDGDGEEILMAQVTYAGGYRIRGRVMSRHSSVKVEDMFGQRLSLSFDSLTCISNMLYSVVEDNGLANHVTSESVTLELKDGRAENVELPFRYITITTAARNQFRIPSFYIARMDAVKRDRFVVSTIFGDALTGRLDERELSFILSNTMSESNRVVSVACDSIATILWNDKDVEITRPGVALSMPEEVLTVSLGKPVEELIRFEEGEEVRMADGPALLQRDDRDWKWYSDLYEAGLTVQPIEKNVDYTAYCDGGNHDVRWRAIDEVVMLGGYTPAEVSELMEEEPPSSENTEEDDQARGREHPKMRSGHVLEIRVLVTGETEIDEPERRITSSGEVSLPLLGTVKVDRMTIEELEVLLTAMYSEYFRSPQVVVQYVMGEETAASPWGYVTVLGTVKEPGKVNIPPTQDLTVSMAVQQAGGLDASANDKAIRVTRRVEGDKNEQHDINLRNVGAKGELKNDMVLLPGDIVYVPEMMF